MGQQVTGFWIHMVTKEAVHSRGQFCDVGLEVSSESSTRIFLSRLCDDFADPIPCRVSLSSNVLESSPPKADTVSDKCAEVKATQYLRL